MVTEPLKVPDPLTAGINLVSFYKTQVVPQRQSNLIRLRHAGFLHRRVIYLSHEGSDYFETAALIDVNQYLFPSGPC